LTAYEGDERDASLSPDGSHIAYSRRASRSDDWDIYVEVVGGPRAQNPIIESPLDDYFPALSPGGSSIAFWRTESQKSAAIMLASALGGAERRLHVAQHPWSDSLDRGRLAWSPDGRSVAASLRPEESGPTRLARLSAETGEVTWLTSPPDDIRGDVMPAFAPDGRSLAFVRRESSNGGHNIFLLPLSVDGSPAGEPIPLTRFKARASAPAWTPDGGELLFLGQQGRGREGLWSVPPSGGEPRLLWRQSGVDLFPSLAVGQDAEGRIRIVFDEVPPEETDIFEVTIDGPERGKVVKLISSSRRDSLAQYSPDGSRIAYYSGWPERDIWVADADGSNPRRLTFHRDRQALPIRWSPSGDRIAYSSGFDPSADVYVVDATGGAPMRITDDTLDEVHPTWSRDGDWIYYSRIHASTSWELWKTPAHGGEPVQLTRGDRHMMADEAADGETLYFLTRYWQGVLWKMPLSDRLGQPEKLLIFSGRGTNGAELSRSGVFFSTNETMETGPLRFLDLATGESRELLEIPGRLSSVHPDESKALTIYGPRAGNDLKMLTVR
jgi:Tol biopolymer transport system component